MEGFIKRFLSVMLLLTAVSSAAQMPVDAPLVGHCAQMVTHNCHPLPGSDNIAATDDCASISCSNPALLLTSSRAPSVWGTVSEVTSIASETAPREFLFPPGLRPPIH